MVDTGVEFGLREYDAEADDEPVGDGVPDKVEAPEGVVVLAPLAELDAVPDDVPVGEVEMVAADEEVADCAAVGEDVAALDGVDVGVAALDAVDVGVAALDAVVVGVAVDEKEGHPKYATTLSSLTEPKAPFPDPVPPPVKAVAPTNVTNDELT